MSFIEQFFGRLWTWHGCDMTLLFKIPLICFWCKQCRTRSWRSRPSHNQTIADLMWTFAGMLGKLICAHTHTGEDVELVISVWVQILMQAMSSGSRTRWSVSCWGRDVQLSFPYSSSFPSSVSFLIPHANSSAPIFLFLLTELLFPHHFYCPSSLSYL